MRDDDPLNQCRDYHVHSNYNDHSAPDLTITNVLRCAEAIGLQTVAFTEHVRKSSEWIPSYLEEIRLASEKVNLEVIPGFEAKILRDGSIDCPERYAREYFLVASFHTKYEEKGVWTSALEKAIGNENVDVIGHIAPESSFELSRNEIADLAKLIVRQKKTIELNAKYHRPPAEWLTIFAEEGVHFHLGSDAHTLHELGQFKAIENLIKIAGGS